MTCQEFCKMFDVYITFDRLGYGQIFGRGTHPPNYMEKEDFWVPTDGKDTGLLPSLVSDYSEYSNKKSAILISPDKIESKSEKAKDKKIVECKDFKEGSSVETNVSVIDVISFPDTANLKLDETVYQIILFDGKHHFQYNTKSKEHPEKDTKVFLKAKVKKQIAQIDADIPMFEISSVKILKAKK